jgi:hypothetical protein
MPLRDSLKKWVKQNLSTNTHLDLSGCGLGNNDLIELQEVLAENIFITSLDLSDNNIGFEGMKSLVPLLSRLIKLDISNNSVGDKGVDCLLANPHSQLQYLNLSNHNCLTDKSARLLLEVLQQGKSKLNIVDVRDNRGIDIELANQVWCVAKGISYVPGQETQSAPQRDKLDIDFARSSSRINRVGREMFYSKSQVIEILPVYSEEKENKITP